MNKEAISESLAIRNELLLLQAKYVRFIKGQRIASLIKWIPLTKNFHLLPFQESLHTARTSHWRMRSQRPKPSFSCYN